MSTVSCQHWYHHWIILLASTLNLCNALWSLQRKSFMGIFGEPDSVLNWTDSYWVTTISISCISKIQHGDFQWSVRESDTPSSCWDSLGSGYLFHCGQCWFLVHQPAQLWLSSNLISVFSWCLDDQLLARKLLEIPPPPWLQHHWPLLHSQSPPHPHLPLLQRALGYQKQS